MRSLISLLTHSPVLKESQREFFLAEMPRMTDIQKADLVRIIHAGEKKVAERFAEVRHISDRGFFEQFSELTRRLFGLARARTEAGDRQREESRIKELLARIGRYE